MITGWLLFTGFATTHAQDEVVTEHDSLSRAINNEVSVLVDSARIPQKPIKDMSTWRPDLNGHYGWPWSFLAAVRSIIANTGNCHWYMVDSSAVCML